MASSAEFLQIQSDVIGNYNDYAEGLDSKKWPLVRSCFADEFLIDYGSLSAPSGPPDVPRRAEDWIQNLQSVINGFDITRHTITNHRVTVVDGQIKGRAYLIADHVIFPNPGESLITDQDVVTVVGEYTNHYQMIGGTLKIIKSELAVHWSSGNAELFTAATENVANQQPSG
jgi:hypothetical protein